MVERAFGRGEGSDPLHPDPMEQRLGHMEKRLRIVEANTSMCVNYVREIAKVHLTPETIRKIEEARKKELEDIEEEFADLDTVANGADSGRSTTKT